MKTYIILWKFILWNLGYSVELALTDELEILSVIKQTK